MESKLIKGIHTQIPLNRDFNNQKRMLHFLTNAICLSFIVILIQQKAIGQNLGINTTGALPDSSAMLDIISPNKGLLIPRVSLTSTTDTITIADPATSLLVYNTNASITGGSGLGYYYYNGSLWVNFVSGSSSSNYVQNQVASDQAAGLRMTGNGLFNGGQLTIGTATPSSGYLLTMNTSSGIGKGLNLTLSGGSGTGINVSSSNSSYDGMLITNSSSSVSSSFYGFGSVLSNTNIVSGYSGYRTSAGLSYGIYGINGTNATYATNASTWAAFLRGRTVISSETSPNSGLGTDLEIRNTTTGAGNPSTVSLRQGTSNTTNATVLANLNFGDNHQTGPQAQIQITRGAAGGASDLPTDMIFSTTPDASVTLTERMRILNNGNVGIGTSTPFSKLDIEGGVSIGTTYSGTTAAPTNGAIVEGNVGIGMTSPVARLDITNTTLLKGLNINMSGTTAFVVDTTYGIYVLNNRGGSNNDPIRYGAYIEGKSYSSSSNFNYGVVGVGTKYGGYGTTTVGVVGRAQHSFISYNSFASDLIGVQSDVTFVADANTVSGSGSGYGFYGTATIPANKTLAAYYGLYLKTPTVNGTLTTKWGIYQQDANSKNFLNGNVGIGTTSPSAKLHTLSTTEQLRIGYDASNYYSTTVGATGGVTFDAVGAGSAFTFNDAVNLPTASVGVTQGLNDSTTKLATTAFVDRALSGVSGGSGWGLTGTSGTTGANFLGTTDNKSLRFRTNNTQKMIIDSLGNVGIGTATPVNPLDVTGKIQATGVVSGDYLEFQGYGTMLAQALSSNYLVNNFIGNGGLGLHSRNTNPMGFLIDGVEKARLSSTGNFGVGAVGDASARLHTTSTTEQLRVGYDASNYYSTTVGSTGAVTFDAIGAGSAFTFSDAVTLPTGSIGVTQSLNDSTTKVATTAFVDRALSGVSGGSGWGLTGTSGTTDGTNFIGTTDNKPFNIKVNNQKAGRIDNSLENIFLGYQAGNSNSSGYYNTAIGNQAFYSNTTGTNNTAVGSKALYTNTTGSYNTATGETALNLNTTGAYNTATGQQTLLYNTTGSSNTATGMQALAVNTTGGYNTASGYGALNANTTGTHNTAVGYATATTNTTGYYNTNIGHGADVSTGALNNATSLGAFANVNATNKVRIGDANVTVIEGQVAFTSVSDGRFKKNINETDVKGLPFIMRLRPVAYNIDTRQFEEFLVKNKPDSVKVKHFKNRDFTASTAIRHNGFIAQEVEQAAQATNYDFTGIHKPESADDNYGLAYSEFVVPLVKAMQEQQKIIDDLKLEIDKLKVEVSKIPK